MIKRIKYKEIEDLKKAKTFAQYSTKFQFFGKWKQHVKKMKVIKEKGKFLEQQTKNKQLKSIFEQIKEKICTQIMI